MEQIDPQYPTIDFFELLRNIIRLNKLVKEYEALREPIIEELMNNPLIKTLFKSALAMEDPTIKTFQNNINKE